MEYRQGSQPTKKTCQSIFWVREGGGGGGGGGKQSQITNTITNVYMNMNL